MATHYYIKLSASNIVAKSITLLQILIGKNFEGNRINKQNKQNLTLGDHFILNLLNSPKARLIKGYVH